MKIDTMIMEICEMERVMLAFQVELKRDRDSRVDSIPDRAMKAVRVQNAITKSRNVLDALTQLQKALD